MLNVYFEGDGDATLLVLGPDDSVACSDDAAETGNLNPAGSPEQPGGRNLRRLGGSHQP